MIPKIRGTVCSGALYWFRFVLCVYTDHFTYLHTGTGIQTCLHFSELCRKGGESDKVRQCSDSWDDQRHACFYCIYCYTGLWFTSRSALSLKRILQRLQVRFALSSSPVFSRTDTVTDSERFYGSVLDLFDDADEKQEVNELILWWNR